VGHTIAGSTGNPSGRYAMNALYYNSSQPADLAHLRVRYATNGIVVAGQSGHRVCHVQALECDRPICVFASNVVVQAALTLTNGVAIGTYGTSGFNVQTASPIRGEGTPLQLNRLVHPQNVQEQGMAWGAGPQFAPDGGSPGPDLRLRWTECSPLPGMAGSLFSSGGSTAPFSVLSYQDCVLRGGSLDLQPASSSAVLVALTNNLLERCSVWIHKYYYSQNTPMAAHLYHNLFRGGSLSLGYYSGSGMQSWNVKDNLFDGATQSFSYDSYGNSMVQRSHNGFITNTATIFGGTGSRTNLVADFQGGPLGRFYYPATGGSSSLTNLVNTGSRLASAAGLYHFTTTTNQVKEATSQVDIGYHYVALDANGVPVDTDGDGIPDYLEDRNGDGSPTGDPTSWQSYNSANGLTGNPGLLVFTPLQ
jgi:hypothetical protein